MKKCSIKICKDTDVIFKKKKLMLAGLNLWKNLSTQANPRKLLEKSGIFWAF
jgi:predicted small integral membrane protein